MIRALEAPGVSLGTAGLIALRAIALNRSEDAPVSALPGGFVTKRRGHGQEMADVREYVPGDDIRHLERGSTARTGVLHIRSFQEERDRVTLLVADFRPSMLWGTRRAFRSVAAAEALVLIGWRVVEEGGRVGLLALGAGDPVAVPMRGRTRGMLAVIGGLVRAHEAALQLALAGADEDPSLESGLARAERLAPTGAEVAIASGFDTPGDGLDDRLGRIARRRVPRLLLMGDGVTRNLPDGTYPIRMPDGSRKRAAIAGRGIRDPKVAETIAGFPALQLDAAAPVEETAKLLAAAFPPDRSP